MAFYTKDLYNSVIKESAYFFEHLKIISGFSSAKFLKRVIEDFPNHKFTLIIGMASKGISIKDHEEYKEITTNLVNVKVFYYIGRPANHMKVYQWYSDGNPGASFLGSANFSEAGFLNLREILVPTIDDFSKLIEDTLTQSVSCIDPRVEDEIPLYENGTYETEDSEDFIRGRNECSDTNKKNIKEDNLGYTRNGNSLVKLLLNNFNLTVYNSVSIELILKDDPHWDTKGLNYWNRENRNKAATYIDVKRTNQLGFKKLDFFPRNTDIQLTSDDNTEWIVRRKGEYGRELVVVKGKNFYEYFKNRLGICESREISYNDLVSYGRTNVNLYKIKDNKYLLDFSLD